MARPPAPLTSDRALPCKKDFPSSHNLEVVLHSGLPIMRWGLECSRYSAARESPSIVALHLLPERRQWPEPK
eukprot:4915437-Heterocapsa_arctica.AAC.1